MEWRGKALTYTLFPHHKFNSWKLWIELSSVSAAAVAVHHYIYGFFVCFPGGSDPFIRRKRLTTLLFCVRSLQIIAATLPPPRISPGQEGSSSDGPGVWLLLFGAVIKARNEFKLIPQYFHVSEFEWHTNETNDILSPPRPPPPDWVRAPADRTYVWYGRRETSVVKKMIILAITIKWDLRCRTLEFILTQFGKWRGLRGTYEHDELLISIMQTY